VGKKCNNTKLENYLTKNDKDIQRIFGIRMTTGTKLRVHAITLKALLYFCSEIWTLNKTDAQEKYQHNKIN
jgi:hypothetical protein